MQITSSKLLFTILFLIGFTSVGQNTSNNLALSEFLINIEDKFDVKFSYSVSAVAPYDIEQNENLSTITEVIEYINSNTPFIAEAIDTRYITLVLTNKKLSVCGILKDAITQEALAGASITISTTKGTISAANGNFSFTNINPTDNITISYLGYQTRSFPASLLIKKDASCKTITLEKEDFALSEIVITQFLTSGLQKTIDDNLIINSDRFGILPGLTEPDVLQTIQVLPGVESIDESINNINVRGGTQDENLMLWDDIVMYHSGHFFGLISAYNPNLTKRIEVTKNGTSSEYGGGVSSTIIMSTDNEVTNELKGGVGLNGLSADAFLQIPLSKNISVQLSGRRSISDQLQTPTYQSYFKRSFQDSEINSAGESTNTSLETSSDFKFYDYSAKLLYDISSRHKFRVSFININNDLAYQEFNKDSDLAIKESKLKQKNSAVGANLTSVWSNIYSTYINTYYTKYNIDSEEEEVSSEQQLKQENEVLETGIKFKGIFKLNPEINWIHGYQFTETGIRNATNVNQPLFTQRKKDVLRSHSLFNDFTYKKGFTFIRTGARISYFEKFKKTRVEPRINARQKFADKFSFKLQGELKYQTATQIIDFEDDFLGVENRRWILANDADIPLIRSKQFSGGIDYKSNGWLIDLTGFSKTVTGITASNQGFQNQFQFIKTSGRYTTNGLEILINKSTNKLSTWLTYTFSKNEYTFKELSPDTFPNNTDLRHSLTFASNYSILNNLKIAAGATYHSGRPYTKPVENAETVSSGSTTRIVNYGLPNGENLDDFFRLDASLVYDFDWNTISSKLSIGVLNVLNTTNTIQQYYQVNPEDNSQAIAIKNNSLGFTPNASLRINF